MNNKVEPKAEERDLQLTLEEIEANETFKNLSLEEKQELIALVYELSSALYHLYAKENKIEYDSNNASTD